MQEKRPSMLPFKLSIPIQSQTDSTSAEEPVLRPLTGVRITEEESNNVDSMTVVSDASAVDKSPSNSS